jgi:hypothetical protein
MKKPLDDKTRARLFMRALRIAIDRNFTTTEKNVKLCKPNDLPTTEREAMQIEQLVDEIEDDIFADLAEEDAK